MATSKIQQATVVSGSNANGRYCKLSDGTMFCWGYLSQSVSAQSTATIAVTFPQTFTGNPAVFTSFVAHVPTFEIATENYSTTGCDIRAKNNYTTALNASVFWIAIGNWK